MHPYKGYREICVLTGEARVEPTNLKYINKNVDGGVDC